MLCLRINLAFTPEEAGKKGELSTQAGGDLDIRGAILPMVTSLSAKDIWARSPLELILSSTEPGDASVDNETTSLVHHRPRVGENETEEGTLKTNKNIPGLNWGPQRRCARRCAQGRRCQ